MRTENTTSDREKLKNKNNKRLIHQKDITILNVYPPKNRAPKCKKHKLTGETDKLIITAGVFKIPHSVRHKISKVTEDLSNTIN